MKEKNYPIPPIVWLKVTDYMHAWLQRELGGGARVKDQRVVCLQHLPGAREILRMETVSDIELGVMKIGNAMSGNRKNMLAAGMVIDAGVIKEDYGMTPELMNLFVPIECPKLCLTKYGVLRPWTLDVNMSHEQASAMQRLIRQTFWQAVEDYNTAYAMKMDGRKYPAIDMIEDFCDITKTPDEYVETIRREWQRRVKRGDNACKMPEKKVVNVSLDEIL